jgi:hypothetical protein
MYMTNGNHTFDPVANIYLFLWTFDTAAIFPHVSVPPLMFHDQRLCQFRRQPGPIRGDRIYVPPLRTRKPIYYSSISYVALQQQRMGGEVPYVAHPYGEVFNNVNGRETRFAPAHSCLEQSVVLFLYNLSSSALGAF